MELRDLPGPLGIEVRGIDLHRPLLAGDVEQLLEAFDRRHLLLFRGQDVSGEEQVRLCRHFGPISPEAGRVRVRLQRPSGRNPAAKVRSGSTPTWPSRTIRCTRSRCTRRRSRRWGADALRGRERACSIRMSSVAAPAPRTALDRERVRLHAADRSRMRERDLAPGSPTLNERWWRLTTDRRAGRERQRAPDRQGRRSRRGRERSVPRRALRGAATPPRTSSCSTGTSAIS